MPFQYWLGKTTASTWAALLYTIPSPTNLALFQCCPGYTSHMSSTAIPIYIPRPTQLCPVSALTWQDYSNHKSSTAIPIYPVLPNYALFQRWPGKTTATTRAALLYLYTQTYPTMPCFSIDLARLQQPQEQHCYTYINPVLPMSAPFLCLSGKDHSSHNSSTDTHVYTQSYPSVPRFCVYLKRPQQPQASCALYPSMACFCVYLKRPQQPQASCALYPSMACFCLYLKRPQQPQRQGWYT